ATRRPTLTQIAQHSRETATEVATSHPALQAPPQDKQLSEPHLVAPASRAVLATPQAAPPEKALAAIPKVRVDSATVGSSPPTKPATAGTNAISAGNLPLSARELAPRGALSKKTVAPEKASADQAANARVPSASESVAVESAAPAVSGPQAAPRSSAPVVGGTGHGNGVGVAGGIAAGAIAADSAKAKQERVAANGLQTQAEILTATQEERSASFLVRTPDKSILWRIGSAGFVGRSEDGGRTWNGTLPRGNAHYLAGSAPSAKVCWLVGSNGIILLTPDAADWQTIPPPAQANFVAVEARDAWTATVTTADGRRFTTTDQGESWTPAN
ncbi:MAG: hypothetical protein WA581_20980, partial [Candidatus Acidiferrales bacterium]